MLYAALPAGHAAAEAVAAVDAAPHRVRRGTSGGRRRASTAPPRCKQPVDVWGPVPALDLMRRVKDQFDPDHRLSPGRFVGGI